MGDDLARQVSARNPIIEAQAGDRQAMSILGRLAPKRFIANALVRNQDPTPGAIFLYTGEWSDFEGRNRNKLVLHSLEMETSWWAMSSTPFWLLLHPDADRQPARFFEDLDDHLAELFFWFANGSEVPIPGQIRGAEESVDHQRAVQEWCGPAEEFRLRYRDSDAVAIQVVRYLRRENARQLGQLARVSQD